MKRRVWWWLVYRHPGRAQVVLALVELVVFIVIGQWLTFWQTGLVALAVLLAAVFGSVSTTAMWIAHLERRRVGGR